MKHRRAGWLNGLAALLMLWAVLAMQGCTTQANGDDVADGQPGRQVVAVSSDQARAVVAGATDGSLWLAVRASA